MSVDAQRLMDLCTYFHIGMSFRTNFIVIISLADLTYVAWSGPFQIVIALVLLWRTMGPSIWAGVAILVLAVPLNTWLAKKMRTLQKRQMGNKDARVKLMVGHWMHSNETYTY